MNIKVCRISESFLKTNFSAVHLFNNIRKIISLFILPPIASTIDQNPKEMLPKIRRY